MNFEFKKAVICGFFGFLTLMFALGLVPALSRSVYRQDANFRKRLLVPVVTALITGLVFVLPVGVLDLILALVGLVFVSWHFVMRRREAKHDVA